jgi:hypothetical protein
MATTNTYLAHLLLMAAHQVGADCAVLHRAEDVVASRPISDVDLIADRPGADVVTAVLPVVQQSGLRLVMLWPYDRGALTTFWMTSDGADGVQLDIAHDPDGRGKYGVRTSVMLSRALALRTVPWLKALPEEYEDVYLLSKRLVKGDLDAAREVGGRILALDDPLYLVEDSLSPLSARRVLGFLHQSPWHEGKLKVAPRMPSPSTRLLRRATFPNGMVIELGNGVTPEGAQQIASGLQRVLVRVRVAPDTASQRLLGRLRSRRSTVTLLTPTHPASKSKRSSRPHNLEAVVSVMEAIASKRLGRVRLATS